MIYKAGKIVMEAAKKKTKCWVYLDKPTVAAPTGLASTIISSASSNSQIEVITHEFDGLTDYRYIGGGDTAPDNYICFGTNDKDTCLNDTDTYLYRIIGVIPTQTTIGGSYEYRVKLIKEKKLGLYNWTGQKTSGKANYSSYSGLSSNYNNWEESRLNKIILNGNFLVGLGEWEKKIGTAVWYLGGHSTANILTEKMYEYERAITVNSGNPTETIEKIGLMYLSDYGYASGSSCANEVSLYTYIYYNCGYQSKNFLYKSGWVLTPYLDIGNQAYGAFYVYYGADVNNYSLDVSDNSYPVWPTFYLISNAALLTGSEGTGTSSDPYLLE